jgi:hypothetical protein
MSINLTNVPVYSTTVGYVQAVPNFHMQFIPENCMEAEMYGIRTKDLYVIRGFHSQWLKDIKIFVYGQQTKGLYQKLWYIYTSFQPKVIVSVPPIT